MGPALIAGRWFDGTSSRARAVLVQLQPGAPGPGLTLVPTGPDAGSRPLSLRHDQVDWPERWRKGSGVPSPVVDLREHGSLEISDAAAWDAALEAAGHRPALAERMQRRWPVFVGVLALAAASLYFIFGWGTPWAATQLTRQVPLSWEVKIAQQALKDLDGHLLQPSKLDAARQARLRTGFEALAAQVDPSLARYPGYRPQLTLLFRDATMPNALALPGGTIVLTDSLVKIATDAGLGDDAVLGVLAHEIGHVVHRHGTRMVVEQGVLNVALGAALGDLSGLISAGGALLTGAAYQRSHEHDADCFALALMKQAQRPTAPMAALLLKLDAEAAARTSGTPAPSDRILSLLSTHPDTAERALRILKEAPPRC
jgi:Zn-dependent protease with chaperone function